VDKKEIEKVKRMANDVVKIGEIIDKELLKIADDEDDWYAGGVHDAVALSMLNRACAEYASEHGFQEFEAYWAQITKKMRMMVYEASKARKEPCN
jgi:hypothetical protein